MPRASLEGPLPHSRNNPISIILGVISLSDSNSIRPLPELWINDDGFRWGNSHYRHSDVASIRFSATVVQNSVNGIPTGKTYQADLSVKLRSGSTISIKGPGRAIRSGLKKESFDGMQQANVLLSHLSLLQRLEPMERELAEKEFFSFHGYQITRARELFRGGQLVARLDDPETSFLKEPFAVVLRRKKRGIGKKLLGMISSDDIRISLEWDQDCFLYMLREATGYTWKDAPPPEKPVDRRAIFYQSVLKFGASLALADGSADASELVQLKKFFDIKPDTVPDAARIFNEELRAQSSVEAILSEFSEVFKDASELRETFLVGMCTVALADGILDDGEVRKLRHAASVLRLGKGSLARAFLAAGFDLDAFMRAGQAEAGSAQGSNRDVVELQVIGLSPDATPDQVRAAYRELVKRYHPDRLRGQGLPESEIAKSEAILQRINVAYDYLTRSNMRTSQ